MSKVLSKREVSVIAVLVFIGLVVLPCLNAFVPPDTFFHVSNFSLSIYGKYLCYAVLAIGVNLLWGYTGLLSLGQALFFSLGGYALGMHLMLLIGKLGQYKSDLPDFMVFLEFAKRFPRRVACRRTGFPSRTSGLPRSWSSWCRPWWPMSSGGWRSARASRSLFFHPESGADLRRDADVFPE